MKNDYFVSIHGQSVPRLIQADGYTQDDNDATFFEKKGAVKSVVASFVNCIQSIELCTNNKEKPSADLISGLREDKLQSAHAGIATGALKPATTLARNDQEMIDGAMKFQRNISEMVYEERLRRLEKLIFDRDAIAGEASTQSRPKAKQTTDIGYAEERPLKAQATPPPRLLVGLPEILEIIQKAVIVIHD